MFREKLLYLFNERFEDKFFFWFIKNLTFQTCSVFAKFLGNGRKPDGNWHSPTSNTSFGIGIWKSDLISLRTRLRYLEWKALSNSRKCHSHDLLRRGEKPISSRFAAFRNLVVIGHLSPRRGVREIGRDYRPSTMTTMPAARRTQWRTAKMIRESSLITRPRR